MTVTHSQLEVLYQAMAHPLGLYRLDGPRGWRRAARERMCDRMVWDGLLKPYVHGGYEITSDGRAAAIDAEITGEDIKAADASLAEFREQGGITLEQLKRNMGLK